MIRRRKKKIPVVTMQDYDRLEERVSDLEMQFEYSKKESWWMVRDSVRAVVGVSKHLMPVAVLILAGKALGWFHW